MMNKPNHYPRFETLTAFFSPHVTSAHILKLIRWCHEFDITLHVNKKIKQTYPDIPFDKVIGVDDLCSTAQQSKYVIVMGGDGTMLRTSNLLRSVDDVIIFGVNTGRLGFLTSCSIDKLEEGLMAIYNKKFYVDKRYFLQLSCSTSSDIIYAMNEFSFMRHNKASMVSIDLLVKEKKINTYLGDGLIIAAPTGSTAYSMSCGGAIVHPNANVILITPINPHSFTDRSLVLPNDTIITIRVNENSESMTLCADGIQYTQYEFPNELYISHSPSYIQMASLNKMAWFDCFREKLLYGYDIRK